MSEDSASYGPVQVLAAARTWDKVIRNAIFTMEEDLEKHRTLVREVHDRPMLPDPPGTITIRTSPEWRDNRAVDAMLRRMLLLDEQETLQLLAPQVRVAYEAAAKTAREMVDLRSYETFEVAAAEFVAERKRRPPWQ